ncbi:hypothetical protein LPC04_10935 [Comamonadaceae bacterium BS-T2-15]|uniref:Uncharacterized protein n=1 Tax=Scleromatobacter humisilvae TaxID=2897159 RepID=A0A9X1YIU8_9BURK|nr:hypothetical protein [Scleromatobacter humisilvae]MCK9686220.1 hypothetical protein [Scleromatobacter humisilvae]
MRLGQARAGIERRAIRLLGLGEALQGLLGDAQRVAQRGVARHARQRHAQRGLGLGVAAQRDKQQAEIGLGGGEVRPQRDGLLEPRDRLVAGAPPCRGDALLEQLFHARYGGDVVVQCRHRASLPSRRAPVGEASPEGYRVSGSKLSAG